MTNEFDRIWDRRNTSSIKWDKFADDVLPLWVADMEFAVAPAITDALAERIKHPVFGYTAASERLHELVVEHLQRLYGWEIEPDWIVWNPGVVAALAACVRAYATEGSSILTNPPIYHHFYQVHNPDKHRLIKVPLVKQQKRWTYDQAAIRNKVDSETSMFMLCSPHNPTGTLFSDTELQEICATAKDNGAIVISDEIHCGLVLSQNKRHVPTALAAADYSDSIVTLMSASKTFNLAGLNCSYAIISNPELRLKFTDACAEVIPFVGTLAYTATEAALLHAEPWRQNLLQYLRENYDYLKNEMSSIDGLELQDLEATYLAWIDATALGLNDTAGFFEQNGLGFSAGEQFEQPHHLRLNFACQRSMLEDAVSRIKSALATLD